MTSDYRPFDISSSEGSLSKFLNEFVFRQPAAAVTTSNNNNETNVDADVATMTIQKLESTGEGLNRITHTKEPTMAEQNKAGFFNLMTTFQQILDDTIGSTTTKTTKENSPSTSATASPTTTSSSSLLEIARELTANLHNSNTVDPRNSQTKTMNKNQEMEEFWALIKDCRDQWSNVALDSNVQQISPVAFMYFLGFEESRLTPSVRRRLHRFFPAVDIQDGDGMILYDLHDALYLATISYMTRVDDIRQALEGFKGSPWVMIYCEVTSRPREPAHYICLQKQQEVVEGGNKGGFRWPWQGDKILDVLLVVRGTKEIADVLSDALIETVPYGEGEDGRAHGGIYKSACYLVEKHTTFLETLLKESGRDKIRLSIIGHSLGAGAGAIATVEFNKKEWIEAKAIGFGCPPVLSQKLSESTKDFITTVICDSDVVPRMSGATISNVVNDVMSRSYKDMAMMDVHQVLDAIAANSPFPPPEDQRKFVVAQIEKKLDEDYGKYKVNRSSSAKVVLFPPGKCIHLYNDGPSYSASYVPCTFFDKIDVTRTMLNDHRTGGGYSRVLHEMMRSHLDDMNFQFPHSVEAANRLCG